MNIKNLAVGVFGGLAFLAACALSTLLVFGRPTTQQTPETRLDAELWRRAIAGDLTAHRQRYALADKANKPYLALQGALMGDEAFAREYFEYFSKLSSAEKADKLSVYRRSQTASRAKCFMNALEAEVFDQECITGAASSVGNPPTEKSP